MKFKSIASLVVALICLQTAHAQPEFSADSIKSICKRVASGRLTSKLSNGWQLGTYFEGVMALYDLTQEKKYLDSTVAWGNYHTWAGNNGEVLPTNFDNSCCFQAYLETYLADPTAANLAHIQNALNFVKHYTYVECPNKCGSASWPIIDMYHMAAPSYPRAAQILKDPVIYDSIYKFSISDSKRHYNVKFHLFNSNCSDTNTTRDWWGRGCGWGVCAICRILQYLPDNHPGRAFFEQQIRETSAKLLTLQNQTDGMWRSELFTPAWNKEASGSAFFCYELFWALRHGILDTATYLGPAKKAWKGLIGCVGVDPAKPNLIGWSQGVGGGPSNTFGITNHDEYTEGGFLMAGNEFYKFVTNGATKTGPAVLHSPATPASQPAALTRCTLGAGQRLTLPQGASGVEFYSPQGRLMGAIRNLTASTRNVSLSDAAQGKGITIVKILYSK